MPLDPAPTFALAMMNALGLKDDANKAAFTAIAGVINAQIQKATVTLTVATANAVTPGGGSSPVTGTGVIT